MAVLRRLDVDLRFPEDQTCCGLPAYDGGFQVEATIAARHFMEVFAGDDAVVVPSAACAAMVKVRYVDLFRDDPELLATAEQLAERTRELTDFLVNVLEVTDVDASFTGRVTYHDACHALHDLGVSEEPRALLGEVRFAELVEMAKCDVCCGFGGQLPNRQPHIAEAMLEQKLNAIQASGADVVTSNDMGCLMYLAGAISRRGLRARPMHLAELLARQE